MWQKSESYSRDNDDSEWFAGQREIEEKQAMMAVIDSMMPEELDRLTRLRFGI